MFYRISKFPEIDNFRSHLKFYRIKIFHRHDPNPKPCRTPEIIWLLRSSIISMRFVEWIHKKNFPEQNSLQCNLQCWGQLTHLLQQFNLINKPIIIDRQFKMWGAVVLHAWRTAAMKFNENLERHLFTKEASHMPPRILCWNEKDMLRCRLTVSVFNRHHNMIYFNAQGDVNVKKMKRCSRTTSAVARAFFDRIWLKIIGIITTFKIIYMLNVVCTGKILKTLEL